MTREQFIDNVCALLDAIDYNNGEMIFNDPDEEEFVRDNLADIIGYMI